MAFSTRNATDEWDYFDDLIPKPNSTTPNFEGVPSSPNRDEYDDPVSLAREADAIADAELTAMLANAYEAANSTASPRPPTLFPPGAEPDPPPVAVSERVAGGLDVSAQGASLIPSAVQPTDPSRSESAQAFLRSVDSLAMGRDSPVPFQLVATPPVASAQSASPLSQPRAAPEIWQGGPPFNVTPTGGVGEPETSPTGAQGQHNYGWTPVDEPLADSGQGTRYFDRDRTGFSAFQDGWDAKAEGAAFQMDQWEQGWRRSPLEVGPPIEMPYVPPQGSSEAEWTRFDRQAEQYAELMLRYYRYTDEHHALIARSEEALAAARRESERAVPGAFGAAVLGGLDTIFGGFWDETYAGFKTGFGFLGDFGHEWEVQRWKMASAENAHPEAFMVGSIAGNFVPNPAGRIARVGGDIVGNIASQMARNPGFDATAAGRMLQSGGEGLVEGAIHGAGSGETGWDRLTGAVVEGGVGASVGAFVPLATDTVVRPLLDASGRLLDDVRYSDLAVGLGEATAASGAAVHTIDEVIMHSGRTLPEIVDELGTDRALIDVVPGLREAVDAAHASGAAYAGELERLAIATGNATHDDTVIDLIDRVHSRYGAFDQDYLSPNPDRPAVSQRDASNHWVSDPVLEPVEDYLGDTMLRAPPTTLPGTERIPSAGGALAQDLGSNEVLLWNDERWEIVDGLKPFDPPPAGFKVTEILRAEDGFPVPRAENEHGDMIEWGAQSWVPVVR